MLDPLGRLLATQERNRMLYLLLYGDSNIGKTQIIVRKLIPGHPPSSDATEMCIAQVLWRSSRPIGGLLVFSAISDGTQS
ncbi:MAG: TniB family NTP-binding protein [Variovorax sp.]|nr:TniB family NTP-binding protein [Variovorax sp.]